METSLTSGGSPQNRIRARQHSVLRTLQLASTLYVPVDGQGLSVVGEELLDWYNGYYDPEGTGAVSNLVHGVMLMKREWEHEDFEEAIVRFVTLQTMCLMQNPNMPHTVIPLTLERFSVASGR